MIQLAWRWLTFQKDSDLARWFTARVADAPRLRKTMIVALARKLLIALWRMATIGERCGIASGGMSRLAEETRSNDGSGGRFRRPRRCDPGRRRPERSLGFHAVPENGSAVPELAVAEAHVASWWDPSGSTEC